MTNNDIYTQDIHPDAMLIRKLMDYNPETGKFIWKKREDSPIFNICRAGKEAGNLAKNGYVQIQNIHFKTILAHRLAWLHYYGKWPEQVIDHIDRNRSNNAICNLRDCSRSENNRNKSSNRKSLSGVKGVHFRSHTQKWIAKGMVEGRHKCFGSFDNIEEAKRAYDRGMENVSFTSYHKTEIYRQQKVSKITHEELLNLLFYNPNTGCWYRKHKNKLIEKQK